MDKILSKNEKFRDVSFELLFKLESTFYIKIPTWKWRKDKE